MSFPKGVTVDVLQKSLDGWWLVKHEGKTALAPATFLKKKQPGDSSPVSINSTLCTMSLRGLYLVRVCKLGKSLVLFTSYTSLIVTPQALAESGGSIQTLRVSAEAKHVMPPSWSDAVCHKMYVICGRVTTTHKIDN